MTPKIDAAFRVAQILGLTVDDLRWKRYSIGVGGTSVYKVDGHFYCSPLHNNLHRLPALGRAWVEIGAWGNIRIWRSEA